MKTKRETPLNIPLSGEVKRKLKVVASERGMSTSELFRTALQRYLDAEGVQIDVSEGLESWGRKSESDKE